MSSKILLSIKPNFANAILSGDKVYEFRRVLFKSDISEVVIYATKPEQRVIGSASVVDVLVHPIEKLWELTKSAAGIDYEYFMSYFAGKEVGCALQLERPERYDAPREITEYAAHPPQSFAYVS